MLRLSPFYESDPVGPVDQPCFLNAVVSVETTLLPGELLRAAKEIERAMGRVPSEHWGPRLIDIDLLLYGDQEVESDELTVPHPEMWNRRFVLEPLRDLLPAGVLAGRVQKRLDEIGGEQGAWPYRPS